MNRTTATGSPLGHLLTASMGILYLLSAASSSLAEETVPVEIDTARIHSGIEKIPLAGTATPRKSSSLSSEIDGLVAELLVDEGDPVKTGDTLIGLDDTIARLAVERARAALEEARETLREAERQRDEAARLVKKRHVAETDYKALVATTRIQEIRLRLLKSDLQRSRELLARYTIHAPFSGVIGELDTEVGQWTETGEALLKLYDINTIEVRVQVPQQYFSLIGKGTPVSVSFDAVAGKPVNASVSKKIPVGDPAARTFPVRIDLENQAHSIAPGMSARVRFELQSAKSRSVLTVPKDAIVKAADGSETVWKLQNNGKNPDVVEVRVKSGRAFLNAVEILDGPVNAGDRIVVRGNEILRPGQKVRVLNPAD